MADTLHATLRPNGTVALGSWAVTGAGSAHAALSDLTDISYIQQTYSGNPSVQMGEFSLPDASALSAGGRVTNVILRFRWTGTVFGQGDITVYLRSGHGGAGRVIGPVGLATAETRIDFPVQADNAPWTIDDVNASTFIAWSSAGTVRILDVWVEVWTNSLPTTFPFAPNAPVATVSSSAGPTMSWIYSDADSDDQERVDLRFFSGSLPVGDPGTETVRLLTQMDIAYSGQNVSAGVWPNGDYVWAVRVKDVGSPAGTWGPWGQKVLTFALPVPAAPSLTATPDSIANRYVLSIDSGGGANPTEQFHVERSDNSGLTWRSVLGLSAINYSGSAVSGADYLASRMARPAVLGSFIEIPYNDADSYNAPVGYNGDILTTGFGPPNVVRYRARASRLLSGARLYGEWTTITPDSLLGDGTTWLKHPTEIVKSIQIQHLANWETTTEEDMAVLRAAGRRDWVVVGGTPSWERGDLEIIFPNDTSWRAFETLRAPTTNPGQATAQPLDVPTSYLLQTCFGDTVLEQMWVRLGPNCSVVRVTTGPSQHTSQYRRVKVGFHRTIPPSGV